MSGKKHRTVTENDRRWWVTRCITCAWTKTGYKTAALASRAGKRHEREWKKIMQAET